MKRGVALLIGAVSLLVSCSASNDNSEVLVMAAASLSDAFAEIEEAFEAVHPDIDVRLNLAGSSSLREQILEGAPADVFASANFNTMNAVVNAGAAGSDFRAFAATNLEVAVPVGNPANISGIADLANGELLVGLCASGVPCGDLAREALAQAGVVPSIDTNEPDARALLNKIAEGELDVGIVYATDVRASSRVQGLPLPPEAQVFTMYPIVRLADAPNEQSATLFIDFVESKEGQRIIASHGFNLPTTEP